MTITLELPQELEDEFAAEAERLHLSLAEYVLRVLVAGRVVASTPRTGADILASWQREGLIGTRSDVAVADIPQYARELRQRAERRDHT